MFRVMSVLVQALGCQSDKGPIAATLFTDAMFDEGLPEWDFTNIHTICKLTGKHINKEQVTGTSLQLNRFIEWVKRDYLPHKLLRTTNKCHLFRALQPQVHLHLARIVQSLRLAEHAEPALGLFFIAASLHLLLLQELSTVDPLVSHPQHSEYALQVRAYAADYSSHAMVTFNNILHSRLAVISDIELSSRVVDSGAVLYRGSFTDKHTGFRFQKWTEWKGNGTFSNGNERDIMLSCEEARTEYIVRVDVEVHLALNDPINVLLAWSELLQRNTIFPLTSLLRE